MKMRLFSTVGLIASLALLLSPVGGVSSTVAEGQPASVETPAPTSEQVRVAAALQGTPVMFIENVGQFVEYVYFQRPSVQLRGCVAAASGTVRDTIPDARLAYRFT